MGPQQVMFTPSSVDDLSKNSFQAGLITGVHVIRGVTADIVAVDYDQMNPYIDISNGPRGGMSWRIFDSVTTNRDEIEAMSQVLMSTGINRRCAPSHLYDLSMKTNIITVVLQWTGDAKHYAFANDHGTGYIVQHGKGLQEAFPAECDALRNELQKFNGVTFAPQNGTVSQQWKDASNQVSQKIDALRAKVDSLDAKDPRRTGVAHLLGLWTAASTDLVTTYEDKKFADRSSHDKTFVPIDAMDMMRNNIASILNNNSPAEQTKFGKWIFNLQGLGVLDNDNIMEGAKAFLDRFGHYIVDGYTEAPTMTAVWTIELKPDIAVQQLLLRRVAVERYFATARTVSEVCDYFAYGIKDAFKDDLGSIKTAVYGYKKPGATASSDLHDIAPGKAKYYLTTEALRRNLIRSDYSLRAFKDLVFNFENHPNYPKAAASWEKLKQMPIPKIAPEYLLGLQKIMAYLFTLRAYAKEDKSGIKEADVINAWKQFNQLEDRKNLKDDGSVDDNVRKQINELREALEGKIQSAEEAMHNLFAPKPYMAFASLPSV